MRDDRNSEGNRLAGGGRGSEITGEKRRNIFWHLGGQPESQTKIHYHLRHLLNVFANSVFYHVKCSVTCFLTFIWSLFKCVSLVANCVHRLLGLFGRD